MALLDRLREDLGLEAPGEDEGGRLDGGQVVERRLVQRRAAPVQEHLGRRRICNRRREG